MKAYFGGSGINITLLLKDKKEGEKKGRLECMLPEWKKPKLVLHIVDEAPEQGMLEEPGFHIEVFHQTHLLNIGQDMMSI